MSSCSTNKAQSLTETEEDSSFFEIYIAPLLDDVFDEPQKQFLAVLKENGQFKCRISLEGRQDLVPSFAEIYPEGSAIYSKRIVSIEKAQNMTNEEKQEVVILPTEIAILPSCELEDEFSISQAVPNMVFTDGNEDAVASLSPLVGLVARATLCACVGGALVGLGFGDAVADNNIDLINSGWRGGITFTKAKKMVNEAYNLAPTKVNHYIKYLGAYVLSFSTCAYGAFQLVLLGKSDST